MWKRNFEATTNLTALKKHAVQSCGQEFITELNLQGLHAKDDEFWQAVNNKLNIPADAYIARQKREGEERERQEQERLEREANETRRLLDNKKQVRKKLEMAGKSQYTNYQILRFLVISSSVLRKKNPARLKRIRVSAIPSIAPIQVLMV
jgi:hypothetical protein